MAPPRTASQGMGSSVPCAVEIANTQKSLCVFNNSWPGQCSARFDVARSRNRAGSLGTLDGPISMGRLANIGGGVVILINSPLEEQ